MSSTEKNGLFTEGNETVFPEVNGIPLRDVDTHEAGQGSIGRLVKDASSQISTLVRTEVELAKAELAQSAKKGAIGGGLFTVAGVIALFSSFFFFFTIAEILAIWLPRWAAFGIVFLAMLVIVAILALAGLKQVKQVKKPEATIDSVGKIPSVIPSGSKKNGSSSEHGLYT